MVNLTTLLSLIDKKSNMALALATINNHIGIVRRLIDFGTDLEVRGQVSADVVVVLVKGNHVLLNKSQCLPQVDDR
jgi:hypothetical protein